MKRAWYVTAKDLLIIGKDRGAWMTLLVTPLLVIMIASFALSPLFKGGSLHAGLMVSNHDSGPFGQQFVDALAASPSVSIVPAADSESQALQQNGNTYALALIIPDNFSALVGSGQPVALTLYEDPNSTTSGPFLKGMVDGTANRFSAAEVAGRVGAAEALKQNPQADAAAVASEAGTAAAQQMAQPPITSNVQTATGKKEINIFDTQAPGYSVMFLLFGVMLGAEGLLEERDKGTLGRLVVAPISKTSILGGKLLAQFVVGFSQVVLLFAVGHFVFGMDLGSSLPGLALMIALTAYTATAFGILLAAVVRTRRQASSLGILIILLMSGLGGSWWPLDIVPDFMQKLGHLTINAWALDGLNALIIHGQGFYDILRPAAVLFLYGSVCFLIGINMFKFRNA